MQLPRLPTLRDLKYLGMQRRGLSRVVFLRSVVSMCIYSPHVVTVRWEMLRLECRHILDNEEDDGTKGDTGCTAHRGCCRSFKGICWLQPESQHIHMGRDMFGASLPWDASFCRSYSLNVKRERSLVAILPSKTQPAQRCWGLLVEAG